MRVQRYALFLVWQVFENKKVRNTKKSITFAPQLRKDRNVAQLVAHYVRDVGVGRSSRLIPTKERKLTQISFRFFLHLTEHPTPVRCGELKQGFRVKRGRSSRLIPTERGSQSGSPFFCRNSFISLRESATSRQSRYTRLFFYLCRPKTRKNS